MPDSMEISVRGKLVPWNCVIKEVFFSQICLSRFRRGLMNLWSMFGSADSQALFMAFSQPHPLQEVDL
jgi:hypothetical protein